MRTILIVDQQVVPSIFRQGTESSFWKELEKKTNKKRKQVTANILGLPKGTKSTLVIFYSEVSPSPKGLTCRLFGLIDRKSTNIFFPKSPLFVSLYEGDLWATGMS